MAKVYVCDSCGRMIKDPYNCKMKEFRLDGGYESGCAVAITFDGWKGIQLCNDCYHGLRAIACRAERFKDTSRQTIKVKYLSDKVKKLDYVEGKSDWIDLSAAEEVKLKRGEFKLIRLGIAMQLPAGYEAHVIPRSSTFKNFGVIQGNSMGLIDESYCGDTDEWCFPAFAIRDTEIHVGDRICQFRIMEHQPKLMFEQVEELGNTARGGFGTTGKN